MSEPIEVTAVEVIEQEPELPVEQPRVFSFPPRREGVPGGMAHQPHLAEIVHARAAEGAVRGWKARRLDQMRFDPQAGAEPQNRPSVLRNIRFEQGDADHRRYFVAWADGGLRRHGKTAVGSGLTGLALASQGCQ